MFASLHYLMALVATGETAAAHELVAAIAARGVSGQGDQARVAAQVGLGLAKAILGIADRRSGRMALDQLARATPQLGGSHIQRDVFVRTLALLAADQGDRAAVARIVAQRTLIGARGSLLRPAAGQARRGRGPAARLMSCCGAERPRPGATRASTSFAASPWPSSWWPTSRATR